MNYSRLTAMCLAAALAVAGAGTSAKADTPLDGLYYNASQPGRGFSLEIDSATKKAFFASYAYDSSGVNTWLISQGRFDGDTYAGRLTSCTGGQTLGGAFKAATCVDAGTLSLAASQNNGVYALSVTYGGSTMALTQYKIEAGAAFFNAPAIGWYYNASQPGTGFFIQTRGSTSAPTMFVAAYLYDASGAPKWYVAEGTPVLAQGNVPTLVADLLFCATGQPLGGNYVAASCSSPGRVTVQFPNNAAANVTWPNGSQQTIGRYSVSNQ